MGGKEGRRLVKLELIIDAMSTKSTLYSTAVSIISEIDANYLRLRCNVRFIIILKMKSEAILLGGVPRKEDILFRKRMRA